MILSKKISSCIFFLFFITFYLFSQNGIAYPTLIGSEKGLYIQNNASTVKKIISDTEIRKILQTEKGWYFLTNKGILFSTDLENFEERNEGLPIKVIKTYKDKQKDFVRTIEELKDFEVDPYNMDIFVTATKDNVFITKDGAKTWKALKAPTKTVGIKAVAVTSQPELLVFASHAIYGPYYKTEKSKWIEINGDLAVMDETLNYDEISDIFIEKQESGPQIWAANSFLPRIYQFNYEKKEFTNIYKEEKDFKAFESLMPRADGLIYITDNTVMRFNKTTGVSSELQNETKAIINAAALINEQIESIYISSKTNSKQAALNLNELWLISQKNTNKYTKIADKRHGFYLQTGFMVQAKSRDKYDADMTKYNIDTLVLDLKDDYGRLRFEPKNELIRSIGRWVNPLDVEEFVADMKAKNRYLIARIVVFKDKHLYQYSKNKYAIWDDKTKAAWQGYRTIKKEVPIEPQPKTPENRPKAVPISLTKEDLVAMSNIAQAKKAETKTVYEKEYFDEYWVDPYCEKVWEYNIAIAKEIIERGFDEIQFDYIRFPTDGENLYNAQYRWRDTGMDKESALMSFLSYARENINAPISVDIYGANGWYRSGVRTGQDVELLSHYVDAICPMFYPSHFEQNFFASEPAVMRPYRIYYYGSLRNSYIARKKVIIRPYVQAFYIPVSYDKKYYSLKYVQLEVDGVCEGINEGLLYWNNSGRYDDLPVLQFNKDGRLEKSKD